MITKTVIIHKQHFFIALKLCTFEGVSGNRVPPVAFLNTIALATVLAEAQMKKILFPSLFYIRNSLFDIHLLQLQTAYSKLELPLPPPPEK